MTLPERQGNTEHTLGEPNVFSVDPRKLVITNPAANIINKERYGSIGVAFNPDRFDIPQVVRVLMVTADGQEKIEYLVVDGLTRTKAFADNYEKFTKEHPDFIFKVRDVTDAVLRDPLVVPTQERVPNQSALNWLQYLRSVVPYTREHAAIASDRIAAHLINAWNHMVGSEIAEKYSATAALSYLSTRASLAPTVLRAQLSREKEVISGERPEQRRRLDKAFEDMAEIIQYSGLQRLNVARAAFELIARKSDVIGGAEASFRQLYGMLRSPAVEAKLAHIPEGRKRDAERDNLTNVILECLARYPDAPNREMIFDSVGSILNDLRLSLDQTVDVFKSLAPDKRYNEINKELNREMLINAYLSTQKKTLQDLSTSELTLLKQLGYTLDFRQAQPATIARGISEAEQTLAQTKSFMEDLMTNRDQLIQNGVLPQAIDMAIARLHTIQIAILASDSYQDLMSESKLKALKATLTEQRRTIAVQRNVFKIHGMIQEVFSGTRQYDDDVDFQHRLQAFLNRIFSIRDLGTPLSDTQVRDVQRRLVELKSLDSDLVGEVINPSGLLSIDGAMKEQRKRRQASLTSKPSEPASSQATIPTIKPNIPSSDQAPAVHVTITPPQPQEPPVVTQEEFEARRLVALNERIRREINTQLRPFIESISRYDITRQQLDPDNKAALYDAVRTLGELSSGYHDIISEVIKVSEQKDNLVQEVTRLRIALVDLQNEIAQKDTRTGR